MMKLRKWLPFSLIKERRIILPLNLIYAVKDYDNYCHYCGSEILSPYSLYKFVDDITEKALSKTPIFMTYARYCPKCNTFHLREFDYLKFIPQFKKSKFTVNCQKPLSSHIIPCIHLTYILDCKNPSSEHKGGKCPYLLHYTKCLSYSSEKCLKQISKDNVLYDKQETCLYKNKMTKKCFSSESNRFGYRCPYEIGIECQNYRSNCQKHKQQITEPHFYDPEDIFEPVDYIDWTTEIKSVYVFRSHNNCSSKKHMTSTYHAKILDITNKKYLYMKVLYCETCKKYYVSEKQIKRFTNHRVFPKIRILFCNPNYIRGKFRNQSELSLYGYNARKDGLDDNERHNLLAGLIDNRLMDSFEIINHLSLLISLHEYHSQWSEAIKKYYSDIDFVNTYKMKEINVNLKLE